MDFVEFFLKLELVFKILALVSKDFERQLAEERRRNAEKEERKREAERMQERGGWNVLDRDVDQESDEDMDVDHRGKGTWS